MIRLHWRRVLPVALAGALLLAPALVPADDWRDDLSLKGLADSVVDGASLRNQPVLLQFWESWCRSCGKVMSDLDEVAARFPSVRYLALSTDDEAADARRRLESHPVFAEHPDRFFHDSGKRLATRFDVAAVPTVLVLDADGRELLRHVGHFNSSELNHLVNLLNELDSPHGESTP